MKIKLFPKVLADMKVDSLPLKEAKMLAAMFELVMLYGDEKTMTLEYYPGSLAKYANDRFHNATKEELHEKIRKAIRYYCRNVHKFRRPRGASGAVKGPVKDSQRSRRERRNNK